jgi:exo-beta-1,3-glucanase (GH17 family)
MIMNKSLASVALFFAVLAMIGCSKKPEQDKGKEATEEKPVAETKLTAADILGNPDYLAISYGGYRFADHDVEPTMDELKADMKLLYAMGIRIVRTYKVHFPQAANLLQAIAELKQEDPQFEMYVMLGAWIDCKNAWTDQEPDHEQESERNATEIAEVARLANKYPEIVKVVAVGNEAMVNWAASYYVQPWVILKWVNHLQEMKKAGELPEELWITSSDDFASWGGGDKSYHTEDLAALIQAVDYVSMHTYPYHNTHYNPEFWGVPETDAELTDQEKIDRSMVRARDFAKAQYEEVSKHVHSIAPGKTIHIGETGWSTVYNGFYGDDGSRATDEYKAALYYQLMREWTDANGISCFYFEAFNEPWKDGQNPEGSENHFGLFTVDGTAKYALWKMVDNGVFEGLTRDGNPMQKSYGGDKEALMKDVKVPPTAEEIDNRDN